MSLHQFWDETSSQNSRFGMSLHQFWDETSSQNSHWIAVVLSTNSGYFPSNSHVSATFSIWLRFGESWNPTNCEKFNADAGRRTKFAPIKSLDSSEFSSKFSDLKTL